MAGALQPEAGPPLLPTPELTWDELESFLDSLLERLQRLPGANPRLTSSYRHGRRGDDQEGIDHYGTYDDGSTSTWQCRARESLGPAAVKEIVRETEVEADRHVIVFGRRASAPRCASTRAGRSGISVILRTRSARCLRMRLARCS